MKTIQIIALAALLAACSQGEAGAQAPADEIGLRRVPSTADEVKASFAPVAQAATPAVVNVYSLRRRVTGPSSLAELFFYGGVPQERVDRSLGSGAIVTASGLVVTNNHVVQDTTEIRVVLSDRREFPAQILLSDARSDIAVLKIDAPDGESFPFIRIDDEEQPQVGDLVLAIGNPYGVGQTVTSGIISALSRTNVGITDYSFFIQTDAAINPGNSGGPLVDMDGEMIGLNTAIYSRSGGSSGIGFAIPAVMVRQVVESAEAGSSRVERPWLGADTAPVTADIARRIGLETIQGVLVEDVYSGSPADQAGIVPGDVILSVDGEQVNDESGVNYQIGTRRAGEQVQLRVMRGPNARDVTARLANPPSTAADRFEITGRNPFSGAVVANISPALAEERGLDPFARGVAVVDVAGGIAARNGMQPGDLIVEVNGVRIDTTARLREVIAASGRQWRFTIQRGGQVVTVNQSI